ncbi:MAG: type VI secretion system contractile sheath large subunit [Candidatus Solibacter sp.]
MTVKSSIAEVNLDIDPEARSIALEIDPDTPFRILLMGAFSGTSAATAKPFEIDRDNFDQVLAKLSPEFAGLHFREIDDFGPDAIFGQKAFAALREAVRTQPPATPAPATPAPTAPPERPPVRPGMSLLDSMLEDADPTPAPLPPVRRGGMEGVVESIVAKYRLKPEDPAIARRQADADAEASECMRAILHAPAFQALEAAWRSVFQLVRAVETGTQLRIYLLDLAKPQLAEALAGGTLLNLLTRGEPWSVVAGNYAFTQSPEDAALLTKLAAVMSAAGAPFLAEADPAAGGDPAPWHAFRQSPAARYLGLAMPRILLRLPYGKKTQKAERFDFEEMPGVPDHQHYLWGNPAFACVQLLAEAFSRDGWEMRVGSNLEVAGLPLHLYEDGGEKLLKPCAEMLLTEKDIEWILDQGYIAMASVRDRDAVRLIRFQSLADPPARLAGRWE